jgi:peroxiredoxin
MSKPLGALGLIAAALTLLASQLSSPADTEAGNVGKKVEDFTLTDPREKKAVRLADFKEKKAVVVVFVGTECPLNNLFLPRLAELQQEFSPKGVQFLGINANRQDSAERVAAHARKFEVPFPVLKDDDQAVADRFGARRTPEAFVLDRGGVIRYQGRIDDQYGIGFQRPKPTRRDLAEAIEEVLAGKPVSQATTPVPGCLIGRAAKPKPAAGVTYTKEVARILQKNCQQCHRPGQVGPMSLLSYDDAQNWAETIREVVSEGRMPPWYADPRYGKFSNDRRLAPEEKKQLLDWIAQGCPKGDDRDLPPPREFPVEWQIGKPDMVLTMPEPFEVPAEMPKRGIPYQHFFIDTNFKEDRWVVRAEARPDAAAVVHHIIVFVLPPGKRFFKDDPNCIVLCGTAPGDMPLLLPPGRAKKIPAGSRLVLQMHYTPNGKAVKDASSVGLVFADKEPTHEVRTVPVFNAFFRIPPGDDNFRVEASYRFDRDAELLAFMPHMHLRGKDFLIEAIHHDDRSEVLLSIPRYNFNWQSVYRLETPLKMSKGSRLRCIAHFDNSSKNPNNPDPTKAVFWGDQTWQEMMIGWTDIAYPRAAPAKP